MTRLILSFLAVTLFSGCILVVDADEFGRHDGLYGSYWVLEVVVWHDHSYRVNDVPYTLTFSEGNALSGMAGCASFDGQYTLSENGELRIDRFRSATASEARCTSDDLFDVFVNQLPQGGSIEVSPEGLYIRTDTGAAFTFTR